MTIVRSVFVCLFLASGAVTASAQGLNVYLSIPGIPGDSTAIGHVGEIDVMAVSQGLFEQGTGKKKHTACDVNVTKRLDSAGPLLWLATIDQDALPDAKVSVEKAGAKPLVFYEVRMTNVTIGSISSSFASDGSAVEVVRLLPQSVTLSFRKQRPDGSPGGETLRTFSCGL